MTCASPWLAGLTGLLAAIAGLQSQQGAPVQHLRALNPYVTASLEEWAKASRLSGAVSRQPAAGPGLQPGAAAGLSQNPTLQYQHVHCSLSAQPHKCNPERQQLRFCEIRAFVNQA